MKSKTCKVKGCGARAWQGELCNLHALEQYRGKRPQPPAERLAQGKQLLRQRARELGITLDEGAPAEEHMTVAAAPRKVRSPVE